MGVKSEELLGRDNKSVSNQEEDIIPVKSSDISRGGNADREEVKRRGQRVSEFWYHIIHSEVGDIKNQQQEQEQSVKQGGMRERGGSRKPRKEGVIRQDITARRSCRVETTNGSLIASETMSFVILK